MNVDSNFVEIYAKSKSQTSPTKSRERTAQGHQRASSEETEVGASYIIHYIDNQSVQYILLIINLITMQ